VVPYGSPYVASRHISSQRETRASSLLHPAFIVQSRTAFAIATIDSIHSLLITVPVSHTQPPTQHLSPNMNRLAFLLVAALPFGANAFGTLGSRVVHSTGTFSSRTTGTGTRPSARFSPLFIASAEPTNGESLPPVVKSIDNEMKKAQKKREHFEAKLNKYATKIAELEQRKQQYLEGASLGVV